MTQLHQDGANLVQIVAPVIRAIPQLWCVIEQQAATIAVLQARVTVLEGEVAEEHERRVRAEDEAALRTDDAEKLYNETLLLRSRLP